VNVNSIAIVLTISAGDEHFEAEEQGTADPYLRLGGPMHTEIGRPDDASDNDEDPEDFDADANKMNPIACGRLEDRQALDFGIHLANPLAEAWKRGTWLGLLMANCRTYP
jgi:hypothetical protein